MDEFAQRCDAIAARGLPAEFVETIRLTGALDILEHLERMDDEQLERMGTRPIRELLNP